MVRGQVQKRPENMVNPEMATGAVEVAATELVIFNTAKTPPIYVNEQAEEEETLRLRYRYLDLRRPEMQKNLALRHRIVKLIRDFLDLKGFWEIETPMLTEHPEGARDTVPTRQSWAVLCLTPIPAAQTIVDGGGSKSIFIARCFRDELKSGPATGVHQIDLEMSFVGGNGPRLGRRR